MLRGVDNTVIPRLLARVAAEPCCHLFLNGRLCETRHTAIGVMDDDQFRPHGAGPWHVGGQHAKNTEIPYHCGGDPYARSSTSFVSGPRSASPTALPTTLRTRAEARFSCQGMESQLQPAHHAAIHDRGNGALHREYPQSVAELEEIHTPPCANNL